MPCHAFITVELKIEEKPRPRQGMCSRGRKNQIVKVSSKSKTENVFHYELLLHTYSCRENIPKKNSLCQLKSAELEKKYHAVKSFKCSADYCAVTAHRIQHGVRNLESANTDH